jgi:hypothetical protein
MSGRGRAESYLTLEASVANDDINANEKDSQTRRTEEMGEFFFSVPHGRYRLFFCDNRALISQAFT